MFRRETAIFRLVWRANVLLIVPAALIAVIWPAWGWISVSVHAVATALAAGYPVLVATVLHEELRASGSFHALRSPWSRWLWIAVALCAALQGGSWLSGAAASDPVSLGAWLAYSIGLLLGGVALRSRFALAGIDYR